jgi:hypothetical protein
MFALLLFGHLVGVALLFAALGIEAAAAVRLAAARTLDELRSALLAGQSAARIFPVAAPVMIAFGAALAIALHLPWTSGWLAVSTVLAVALTLSGPLVVGRSLAALGGAASAASGEQIGAQLDRRRRHLPTLIAQWLSIVESFAILYLMCARPALPESLAVAAAAAAVAVIAGLRIAQREATLPVAGHEQIVRA